MKDRTIPHTTKRKERYKGIYKGQEHEEEDINSYLRKRKTCITLWSVRALEDAMDLSQDSLRNDTD